MISMSLAKEKVTSKLGKKPHFILVFMKKYIIIYDKLF